jgi:hypothetical protein
MVHITCTTDPDPNAENTTVTNDIVDSFRKARSALITHLTDNQLIHATSLEWARKVWIALAVMSSKLNIKEMLNTFNYESTNMKEHLTTFQHIVVKLHAVGCTVSESDLVARLLQSLPSDYGPLVEQ